MTSLTLETVTVDDLEITLHPGGKLTWIPSDRQAKIVRYALEHSIAVCEGRLDKLERALLAVDALAESRATRKR
jgi:hypothetical protein